MKCENNTNCETFKLKGKVPHIRRKGKTLCALCDPKGNSSSGDEGEEHDGKDDDSTGVEKSLEFDQRSQEEIAASEKLTDAGEYVSGSAKEKRMLSMAAKNNARSEVIDYFKDHDDISVFNTVMGEINFHRAIHSSYENSLEASLRLSMTNHIRLQLLEVKKFGARYGWKSSQEFKVVWRENGHKLSLLYDRLISDEELSKETIEDIRKSLDSINTHLKENSNKFGNIESSGIYALLRVSSRLDGFLKEVEGGAISHPHERDMANLEGRYVEATRKLLDLEVSSRVKKERNEEDYSEFTNRSIMKNFVRKGGKEEKILDSEHMMEKFNLRAVRYGESIPQNERWEMLTRAAASLNDMSDVLGVEPSSLGGKGLALAFGERGRAHSCAQYFPDQHIINLNRDTGDGTIAHEFFHAIDFNGDSKGASNKEHVDSTSSSKHSKAMKKLIEAMTKIPKQDALNNIGQELYHMKKRQEEAYAEYQSYGNSQAYKDGIKKMNDLAREANTINSMRNSTPAKEENKSIREELSKKHAEKISEYRKAVLAHAPAEKQYEYLKSRYRSYHDSRLDLEKQERRIKAGSENELFPSKLLRDSLAYDSGKNKSYWATNEEMAARCFETYISDRLKEAGRANNFLVKEQRVSQDKIYGIKSPYPVDKKEKARIFAAMEEYIEELKSTGRLVKKESQKKSA